MIEEDGKEREADMGNQGEGEALGRGVRKSPGPVCLFRLHPHSLRLQSSVCLWTSSYFLPLSVVRRGPLTPSTLL